MATGNSVEETTNGVQHSSQEDVVTTASLSHALPTKGRGSEPLYRQYQPGRDAALSQTVCEAQKHLATDHRLRRLPERCFLLGSVSGVSTVRKEGPLTDHAALQTKPITDRRTVFAECLCR